MTCFVQIAFHLSFFFYTSPFFYMCECVHVRIFYVAFLLPLAISKIKRLKPTGFFVSFLFSVKLKIQIFRVLLMLNTGIFP